jgi:ATP-dependent helicase/nuclease subunit A
LQHLVLRRAQAAQGRGQCRRETPVTLCEPDGTIVEGVVDLAFADEAGWTVVDFKTDVELDGRLAVYERQVALYAAAIAAATGAPAVPILLRV